MRITLTEILGKEKVATHQFDQPEIKIGRDPDECDLTFDQSKWLMVSRLHATIRYQSGKFYVEDLGSRQGTYVNGERIENPTEIPVGAQIQFGQQGPLVSVDSALSDRDLQNVASTIVETPTSPKSVFPAALAKPAGRRSTPLLVLESGSAKKGESRFEINKERTVLGRDAVADVQVEAAAPVVSRRHSEINRRNDGRYVVTDLQSFNGTLVNGQRISQPTVLESGDRVQLSIGGPVLRFVDPDAVPSTSPMLNAQQSANVVQPSASLKPTSGLGDDFHRTIVSRAAVANLVWAGNKERARAQFLYQCSFDARGKLSVGRAADNDIQLDAFLISNHHARFMHTAQGVVVVDAGSTNGVYLNGVRVTGWRPVTNQDIIQIGPFVLTADIVTGVTVFDTRSKTRVDAVDITDVVKARGGTKLELLHNISLAIEPNEFVGVLGPSGAGKSLLLKALNGMRRTSGGRVLINNLDLYQHLDSLKLAIGHVPQDDIIHQELTVYRTLYYVARMRLSRDVRTEEIDQIINEVLEVTGLTERRDVRISQLSGGQRKRVSIAVELITRPSIIFLDEPTSGLDPATEERIMKLFRQIAESGRTVILTTHAMENVYLFDKVALLFRGRLIFYGTPAEALNFIAVDNFVNLYNRIEEQMDVEVAKLSPLPRNAGKTQKSEYDNQRNQIADTIAEQWRQRFAATDTYQLNVAKPIQQLKEVGPAAPAVRRRSSIVDSIRQWSTLVRRYTQVLLSDKLSLVILFAQAPIIAVLTYLVVSKHDPRDFPYFVLGLVPVWFGTSLAAREIVKERSIYHRERMVNLRLLPYVASKLFALACIVSLQCLMLFGTLKILYVADLMYVPGSLAGLPQLLVMLVTGVVGVALGLFVSSVSRTSGTATSIVPLLLIPQILLCGLVGVPAGAARVIGTVMPATWSFDAIKRLSTLDTLREEGSSRTGTNRGRGLYKHTEEVNDQILADARQRLEAERKDTENKFNDYDQKMKDYLNRIASGRDIPATGPPPLPHLEQSMSIPEVKKINDDLSGYVTFKHPWGGLVIDPVVLLVMFFGLVIMTLIALRAEDG
ncbi:MAG: FHA domain-containing protein [Pyrinomonadaceae bacterium]